jgi:uncharacterized protein (DUF58 family)
LAGLLLVAVSVLVGLSAIFNQANLLFLIGMVSFSTVGVAWWSSRACVDGIVVQRILPSSVTAGRRFIVTYCLRSERTKGKSYSIRIRDPLRTGRLSSPLELFIPVLSPGQEIEVNVPAMASSRGILRFEGMVVETRFPFGLTRRYRRLPQAGELIVFPAFLSMRRQVFSSTDMPTEAEGRAGGKSSSMGEFFGLRDYRHGDNPHWIHWRRSAKTGKLVVREMIEPHTAKVLLIVDLGGSGRGSGKFHEDWAELLICAAATLGCAALDSHACVGWVVMGKITSIAPPTGGSDQRGRLLRTLTGAEYRSKRSLQELLAETQFPRGGAAFVYILTQAEDAVLTHTKTFLNEQVGQTQIIRPFDEFFDRLFYREPKRNDSPARGGN